MMQSSGRFGTCGNAFRRAVFAYAEELVRDLDSSKCVSVETGFGWLQARRLASGDVQVRVINPSGRVLIDEIVSRGGSDD